MNKPLGIQILILVGIALLLGAANKIWLDLPHNGRSASKIPWVRHWTPYSQLQPSTISEEVPIATTAAAQSEQAAPAMPPEAIQAGDAGAVSERIVANQGITDIGLEEAYQIFTHGQELTLWIDARDENLYQAGHIKGAHLLHFYNQSQYIESIRQVISEQAPEALVIYCKGKDCTDSHHLAEDLQNTEGYPNIFVYTGGFDDWLKAGFPVDGTSTSQPSAPQAPTDALDPTLQQSVPEMVLSNDGIREIGLEEAYQIFRYAPDLAFWIDARDPELYAAGHIEGAHLLHYYNQNAYLETIKAKLAEVSPEALVIYCKGKECTDSHHLAEELLGQDLGGKVFTNIFVYKDGFDDWSAAGYPTQPPKLAETPPIDMAASAPAVEKAGGMYLEHIIRDLVPFIFGLFLLITWKRASTHLGWIRAASIVVGLFFIWAAWPKLVNPLEFAKSIWNYDIAPGVVINGSALFMPALELIAGLGLVTGVYRRGSAFLVNAMLVIFIIAVSYNVLRGHEFNCGCTSTQTLLTDAYVLGWNDKYLLLLRDFGLLVMGWLGLRQVSSTTFLPHESNSNFKSSSI